MSVGKHIRYLDVGGALEHRDEYLQMTMRAVMELYLAPIDINIHATDIDQIFLNNVSTKVSQNS
jgi:hypothetical protein